LHFCALNAFADTNVHVLAPSSDYNITIHIYTPGYWSW